MEPWRTGVCDKCGGAVPINNDVATLIMDGRLAQMGIEPLLVSGPASRHLFPVTDDKGQVVCEGSPSRAQYLGGLSDAYYPMNPHNTWCMRDALRLLVEHYDWPSEAPVAVHNVMATHKPPR